MSKGNILSQDMVRSMAESCIVFALANPTPEISYEDAMAARKDIIVATGRSDHPNQVNNVLGFPFIKIALCACCFIASPPLNIHASLMGD